ncbi:MAG: o-succinylbenzoate synthase [Candidatus Acidiferrum sp.]
MKIKQLTLRELHLPLLAPFETSATRISTRRILLVEMLIQAANGPVTGWGECVADDAPSYSPETVDTAWHMLTRHLWPLVKDQEFAGAEKIWDRLLPVRGHNMAKAALETAVWDAAAKDAGSPLWRFLGGAREEIASGVSIGIKRSLDELRAAVELALAAGYQRIKIKIKPGHDLEPVRFLRQEFPAIKLMVDANSAYRLEDLPLLKQLDAFYLMMIEQPLAWDDIYSHAELQKQLQTPLCLDECIYTEEHAAAAIALRACSIINIKLGRVGGYTPARRIHDLCRRNNIPVWCGGMLESGIGRAHNLALSTLANFTLPGDVAASKRYWSEDIINPEVVVSSQGTVRSSSAPGIGYVPVLSRIEKLTAKSARLA